MTGGQFFVLLIVAIAITLFLVGDIRRWIVARVFPRPGTAPQAQPLKPTEAEQHFIDSELRMTAEEKRELEIQRLENLIEDQKQIAREADLSYHLWNLYVSHFRNNVPGSSPDREGPNGKWYEVRILDSSIRNGLRKFEFELMGKRYTFADDEEQQGWRDQIKLFSLFLYDDSGRCLYEIPMKIRVDGDGRKYSILSHGPEAFLQGDWVNNFINVNLKHQHLRNQDFREQKLQERLRGIEELKDRFGIQD